MKAKEELSAALEKAQEEARQQQEALAIQVSRGVVADVLCCAVVCALQVKQFLAGLKQALCGAPVILGILRSAGLCKM